MRVVPRGGGMVSQLRARCTQLLHQLFEQLRRLRTPTEEHLHQIIVVLSMCTVSGTALPAHSPGNRAAPSHVAHLVCRRAHDRY